MEGVYHKEEKFRQIKYLTKIVRLVIVMPWTKQVLFSPVLKPAVHGPAKEQCDEAVHKGEIWRPGRF
jgi:hypothetical protein